MLLHFGAARKKQTLSFVQPKAFVNAKPSNFVFAKQLSIFTNATKTFAVGPKRALKTSQNYFCFQKRTFASFSGTEEDLLPVPLLDPDSSDANASFHHPLDINQDYIDQEVQTAELHARNTYGPNYRTIGLGLTELGSANLYKKKYFKAESYYLRAYWYFKEILDFQAMSHVNLTLGKMYLEMGQYDKVISTCETNLVLLRLTRLKKKNGKQRDVLPTLVMLEKAHEEKKDFKKAEATLAALLEEYKKLADPPVFLGEIYIKIGQMYQSNRKFQKAQKAFEQALAIHEFMWGTQHPIVATSISCLGRLKLQQKKYGEAKKYIDQALSLREMKNIKIFPLLPVASAIPGSELAPAEAVHWDPFILGSSYEDLANYHEAVGELEQALAARKKHLQTISSLNIASVATLYVDHPRIPFLKQAIKNLEERIAKKNQEPPKVVKPKRTSKTLKKISKLSKITKTPRNSKKEM